MKHFIYSNNNEIGPKSSEVLLSVAHRLISFKVINANAGTNHLKFLKQIHTSNIEIRKLKLSNLNLNDL